jgi:hypothetical protein
MNLDHKRAERIKNAVRPPRVAPTIRPILGRAETELFGEDVEEGATGLLDPLEVAGTVALETPPLTLVATRLSFDATLETTDTASCRIDEHVGFFELFGTALATRTRHIATGLDTSHFSSTSCTKTRHIRPETCDIVHEISTTCSEGLCLDRSPPWH